MKRATHKQEESLPAIVRLLFLLMILLISFTTSPAQTKTKKQIVIENADSLLYNEAVNRNAQRLIGNVKMTHKQMVIYCDSAWSYSSSNSVDAFGNVHIINNDTVHMWARYIHYDGERSMAKARKNVVLKDPRLTLTTDSLDFDTKDEIGYYQYGGKIVDSTNTLTSIIGRYYTKINELFFKDSVKLVNDDYVMTSDTMKYNTKTEVVHIVGPTRIIGDSTYLYSEMGWFDTKNNLSELTKNSTIRRGDTQLAADSIYYNDHSGNGTAKGNVVINDFVNSIIVAGGIATYNDFSKFAEVTDSALFIQYSGKDSLFLHADTLYTKPDSIAQDQKIIIASYNVRFYKEDMQGTCDSLMYFTNDSITQLYIDPVIWSDNNQMSAIFIEIVTHEEPPNKIFLNDNSFIIQEIDSAKYNQIKGKNMIGYIEGKNLYQIDVNGNGQSIYYPADDEDYIGVNKAESSNIVLYMSENKIKRISFLTSPVGVMNPLEQVTDPEKWLEGFEWRGSERPISKYDIYRTRDDSPVPSLLPKSIISFPLPGIDGLKKELTGEPVPE